MEENNATTSLISVVTDFNIKANSKEEVIKKIAKKLSNLNIVRGEVDFAKDVFEREDELPTYIGHNIGLPHSQSDFVNKSAVAIVRLDNFIVWNDDNKVNLIFLIAVPKKAKGNLHLKILANLSRLLVHDDFRKKLSTLDEEEVKKLMYSHMDIS